MVGSVRFQSAGARKMAHFTLATSRAYRDRNGNPQIDTSWHNVTAWEGKEIKDIEQIEKGDRVYVAGRLKYTKFAGPDGVEHFATDIVASKVNRIGSEENLAYEMF